MTLPSAPSASRIAACIASCDPRLIDQVDIRLVERTGSTNADLLAALDCLSTPTVLIANEQTAGRGRAGRSWISTPGKSLTFSLAWKFDLPVHALVGLPLVVGVVIAEALATFDVRVRLKWPNDVLHDDGKLAGILIETAEKKGAGHEANWAVIGIGMNLALDGAMMKSIAQSDASLSSLVPRSVDLDQDHLLASLLTRLVDAMRQFERQGLHAFVDRWNALHAHAGRHVAIVDHGQLVCEGIATGIDWIGRLLIETEQGRVAVMAGDVSLRMRGKS